MVEALQVCKIHEGEQKQRRFLMYWVNINPRSFSLNDTDSGRLSQQSFTVTFSTQQDKCKGSYLVCYRVHQSSSNHQ